MTTVGTILYTWINGTLVGTDEFENRYYKSNHDQIHGRQRRWVIYKGAPEASKIPSEWHAWLHHTTEGPLVDQAVKTNFWQKSHEPNYTGTPNAHIPCGHDLKGGIRATTSSDYEAWVPE